MALRNTYPQAAPVPLNVVTRHRPADSYVGGHLHQKQGWYWWWEAISPNSEALVSVVKGPFVTESRALQDAARFN